MPDRLHEWQPDGPNAFVRWRQRQAVRKYGPPKMSWIEAEMLAEQQMMELMETPRFWVQTATVVVVVLLVANAVAAWGLGLL